MNKSIPVILLSAVMFCLLFGKAVSAQNTLTYSTVDYDEETNTVYGYAYTEPDYAAGVYYTTAYVGAGLKDNNDTSLGISSTTCYGCRAEVNLQATGTGSPPYKILTGHYVFLSYYVYNYYDPYYYQYKSGYLDYYYYTYFEGAPGGPILDFPLYFNFQGRSPATVAPSVNRFLGTLLTSLFPETDDVIFQSAAVYDKSANFTKIIISTATISMLNSSHAEEVCGDNPQLFTLRINFSLKPNTTLVANRCSARPVNIPDQDYNVGLITACVIDDSSNNTGHMDVNVRRRCCNAGNANPKISVGIGCNRNGPGICDTKAVVKILC